MTGKARLAAYIAQARSVIAVSERQARQIYRMTLREVLRRERATDGGQ